MAVRKPDNHVAYAFQRVSNQNEEELIDPDSRSEVIWLFNHEHVVRANGAVTRSDSYAPRDVNVIYHSWPIQQLSASGEDYRWFSSSVRHSPIKVRPPKLNPLWSRRITDLSCSRGAHSDFPGNWYHFCKWRICISIGFNAHLIQHNITLMSSARK